jgi:hypothetical protein
MNNISPVEMLVTNPPHMRRMTSEFLFFAILAPLREAFFSSRTDSTPQKHIRISRKGVRAAKKRNPEGLASTSTPLGGAHPYSTTSGCQSIVSALRVMPHAGPERGRGMELPLAAEIQERRQECRRSRQECLRHEDQVIPIPRHQDVRQ